MTINTMKTAVLIKTVGIQQYIYNSNKLKENIGASCIIEEKLAKVVLTKALRTVFNNPGIEIDKWKTGRDEVSETIPVGFIGGGNTLVFLPDHEKAKEFIALYSKSVLLDFPGLKLSFGIRNNFDFVQNYQAEFKLLVQDLTQRRSAYIPVVNIPKHGITADCPISNDAAEEYDQYFKDYISLSSAVKISNSENSKWDDYLKNRQYIFKSDIEQNLGQKDKGSYISVVHIDGNGMGDIFSQIKDLKELRGKSVAVSKKATGAMENLIDLLIEDHIAGRLSELNLSSENNKTVLPLRPVLVGGDDVTFICEGRLGLYLAEQFINFFFDEAQRSNKDDKQKLMDGACAGVAIVKTHFPFYKAVKLAEELCKEAKHSAKDPSTRGCYISYYYSATTFAGSLVQLRARTHMAKQGNMYYGPYKLFDAGQEKSIEGLKAGIMKFKNIDIAKNDKNWPKNKVMTLREIIAGEKGEQQLFEKELNEIGLKLPGSRKTIWDQSGETPFFDQIELMDFYSEKLLNKK